MVIIDSESRLLNGNDSSLGNGLTPLRLGEIWVISRALPYGRAMPDVLTLDPFEVIDASKWDVVSEEPMGSKAKRWLLAPDGVRWLFKQVRLKEDASGALRVFGEDWSEKLAAEVAHAFGLAAARVQLAVRHGQRGALSRSALPDEGHDLVHGNELLQRMDPAYDKARKREV